MSKELEAKIEELDRDNDLLRGEIMEIHMKNGRQDKRIEKLEKYLTLKRI